MPTFRSPLMITAAALAALGGGSAFAVETDTTPPGMERPEAQSNQPVKGHIVEMDVATRSLHVREMGQDQLLASGDTRELTVAEDCRVKLDGQDASFADLRVGDRAIIHLQRQDQAASAPGLQQQRADRAQQQPGQRAGQDQQQPGQRAGQGQQQPGQRQGQQQGQKDTAKLIRAYRTEPAPFTEGNEQGGAQDFEDIELENDDLEDDAKAQP